MKKLVNESLDSFISESKKMKNNPCWDGYEMIGTKKKDGKEVPNCVKEEEEEEILESSSGIPDRYKEKGFTKVGVKKRAPEGAKHKWEVLAKKGDKYRIIKGGTRGMDDFSQHKDPERRKAFWDRMGGKDSAKANDPFSPLYWHKRFKTW